ncbi:hypothetical protein H6F44_13375 [Pseudanabaena sp. FACHB-1277]|uniref:Uncharacterized protein n=1 Tax=Pseudanabaena cinerea FACHB-1277 TaxID=2949581 RepID=A0A926Z6W6_9CYAN|nr:hypothetical protein [Pseudanabaena cinerea]MBD2151102.1 hypothetical protein [Pseudanabaena cinerea FACHB-1277]
MSILNYIQTRKKIESSKNVDILWYIALLFFLLLVVTLQSLAKNNVISISNFYIPDSYTYELRLLGIKDIENEGLAAQAYNILNKFLYSLGSHSFFIFNASLLFLSINICRDVFRYISSRAISYARLAIVANPYLLIGAVGPNKETILIFLCLLFWKFFFKPDSRSRIIILTIIATAPIFIRPIVSFPLYVCIFIYPLIKNKYNKPRAFIIAFLGFFFLLNSIPFTKSLISSLYADDNISSFATSRIYDISLLLKNYSQDIILQYPAFVAKSVIFLFAPIVRPLTIFESPLPLLDVGYSWVAFLLFPFNLSLTLASFPFWRTSNKQFSVYQSMIFFYSLLSIVVIILNPILTFRYIFPFTPFVFACFALQSIKVRNYIIYFSIVIILISVWLSVWLSMIYNYNIEGGVSTIEAIPEFLQWL